MDSEQKPMADRFETVHDHLSLVDDTLDDMADDIQAAVDEALEAASVDVTYDLDDGSFEAHLPLDEITSRLNTRLDPPFFVKVEDQSKLVVTDVRNEFDVEADEFNTGDDEFGTEYDEGKYIRTDRDGFTNTRQIVEGLEGTHNDGAPEQKLVALFEYLGMDKKAAEKEIEKLKLKGEVYEPRTGYLRTT